jgi:hypothetical protein
LTNYLRVLDTTTGREVAAIPNSYGGAFAPDDGTLAVIVDGGVQLWDMPPRHLWAWIMLASTAATVVVYCFLVRWRHRSNAARGT